MKSRDFRQYLTQLRTSAGLSNRDLAARAGVPHSFVAGLQAGSRRVGEIQARKIGMALGLNGEDLEVFVLLGIDTCSEKVLNDARGYPASLLNLIATQLRGAGIFPELLSRCDIKDADKGQHISLHLHNGKTAHLMTELAMS
jgi:transcriptional regulator with XRE-family HTH domain